MDEEIERLVVSIRADTSGFAKDVGDMQSLLDGPFANGLERAGSLLETTLGRAIRKGSLDFQDLKRVALSVISDIAGAAINSGIGSILGSNGSGLLGAGTSILTSLLGAPGRAIGGPVGEGRPYIVGERGPELFVPASAGRVEPHVPQRAASDIRLTINISDNGQNSAPDQMRRSSRQVARAVRNALASKAG